MTNQTYGVLGRSLILDEKKKGNIIIEPFLPNQLQTSSYDVCIGTHYYSSRPKPWLWSMNVKSILVIIVICIMNFYAWYYDIILWPQIIAQGIFCILNVFLDVKNKQPPIQLLSGKSARLMWSKNSHKAMPFQEWITTTKPIFMSDQEYLHKLREEMAITLHPDDLIIPINPQETILGHTIEFIGTKAHFTTSMQTRSTVGRTNIMTCKCAGWGDIGYFNRWTMEITNISSYPILIRVGDPIAQIVFFSVAAPLHTDDDSGGGEVYTERGHYQGSANLDELKKAWEPSMMLPSTKITKENRDILEYIKSS
jgi:deoxycytidine triphosphate deaminase